MTSHKFRAFTLLLISSALLLTLSVGCQESEQNTEVAEKAAERLAKAKSKTVVTPALQDPTEAFDGSPNDRTSSEVLDKLLDEADQENETDLLRQAAAILRTEDAAKKAKALESNVDNLSDATDDGVLKKAEPKDIKIAANWKQINPKFEIWVDKKAKQVMFSGEVCLNDGQLEMFVCPHRTKTHESVISASCEASNIHMALLVIDCEPGKTCSWDPVYRPAWGPTIDIDLSWHDEKTQKTKTVDAKQWIRDVKTEKAMTQKWIFGGSEFWTDPDTKRQVYYANSGELICLSNFSTATIDVGVQSSDADDGLLFETFTENIPPIGTKVYVILKPGAIVKPEKIEPKKEDEGKKEAAIENATNDK